MSGKEAIVQELINAIENDPVELEVSGFSDELMTTTRLALKDADSSEFIELGISVLQIATGLANIGHQTPVAQLTLVLDEIGPRARQLAAELGSDSDAARLQEASKLVGSKSKPKPAKVGDARPEGALSVQAFKIPVR